MKRCLMIVAPLGVLAGLALLNASRGQSPSDLLVPQSLPPSPGGGGGFGSGAPYAPVQYAPMGGAGVYAAPATARTRSEISKLVGELRDATEEAKKTEITKKLEAAVTKAFDEDQKNRETELTKLEERLKKLRTQLDRRAKAKADIIQLQLKVLANEAEGLGFSGTSLLDQPGRIMAYPVPLGPNALQPPARLAPAAAAP